MNRQTDLRRLVYCGWFLALGLGCTPPQMRLDPPPSLPPAVVVPAVPQPEVIVQDFERRVVTESAGNLRINQRRDAIGVAPIAHTALLDNFQGNLIQYLLENGFNRIIDLSPAHRVLAAHERNGRGDAVNLYGLMSDVLLVADVSAAEFVIAVEVLESGSVQEALSVAYHFDDSDLRDYQDRVDAYHEHRAVWVSDTDASMIVYGDLYEDALSDYEALPNFLGADPPPEYYYRDQLRDRRRRLLGNMPEAPSAQSVASAATSEVQPVNVYTARVRFRIIEPATGSVGRLIDLTSAAESPAALEQAILDGFLNALGE